MNRLFMNFSPGLLGNTILYRFVVVSDIWFTLLFVQICEILHGNCLDVASADAAEQR
jgi:hypothetical protein